MIQPKQIIIFEPEYQCWPLWLYDWDDTFIDNVIPEDMQANEELMEALTSVQQQFDALYLNTPLEFAYIGFPDKESKERFIRDSWRAYELLCNAGREKYKIRYAIDYEGL